MFWSCDWSIGGVTGPKIMSTRYVFPFYDNSGTELAGVKNLPLLWEFINDSLSFISSLYIDEIRLCIYMKDIQYILDLTKFPSLL